MLLLVKSSMFIPPRDKQLFVFQRLLLFPVPPLKERGMREREKKDKRLIWPGDGQSEPMVELIVWWLDLIN